MTPTLIASYQVDSVDADILPLVTPSFTPSNGEIIVVKASGAGFDNPDIGAASGGGQTYTSRIYLSQTAQAVIRISTAVVSGSPGSMAVTQAIGGTGGWHSMVVERWEDARLAASPVVASGFISGAPSLGISTVADNSIVSWVSADWNAQTPGTPAYRSSATQDGLHDKSAIAAYVAYYAYQSASVAGAQIIGLTSPSGQLAAIGGVEIQGYALPVATTQPVTDITDTAATGNGTVVDDGGSAITERGVCWSTSLNPTTGDSKATSAGTTGSYAVSITGLTNGTLYHARAYAINSVGTSYGSDVTFQPYAISVSWFSA